jgi:nicotinamide-nucleotide amidase
VSAPVPQVGALRAAVLSVGSELLLGDLTDTNATWVSARLRERGVSVVHHLAARDVVEELVDALRFLAARADLVLVGGGLGPTSDDLTREALAVLAGVELELREDMEEEIRLRLAAVGRPLTATNRRQAFAPVGARVHPPVGTAPSLAIDLAGDVADDVAIDGGREGAARTVRVIALPGVPWELHALWDAFVVPQLVELGASGVTRTTVVHVLGRGESDVAALVEPLLEAHPDVTLSFLAKKHEIQVRLTGTGRDDADARTRTLPALADVLAALGADAVGVDEDDLETTVVRLLARRGERVATAESATAGAIAARLGAVPGASEVLLGALVTYDASAKVALAGLDGDELARVGTVSAATTEALARAARVRTGADWGIGVTGVAGPTSVDGLPVGTAFWALAGPDGGCEVHDRVITGDRATVVTRLGSAALDLLRRRLAG